MEWRRNHPEQGVCLRCRHTGHLNSDRLCRACLHAVRLDADTAWVTDPDGAGPRSRQLTLLYSGLAPSHAQPLKKYGRRTGRTGTDQRERLHWVEQIRAAAAPTRDDPAVLPPAVLGQLPLFPVRRMLSIDVCRRILQRPLAGYREVVEHTAAFAADTGIGKPMQRKLHEMLRLALAVRDADGDDIVDELVLDDIPNYGRSVRAILLRAQMLRLLPEPREPGRPQRSRTRTTRRVWGPLTMTPRSCQQCGSWFAAKMKIICEPCSSFARKRGISAASTGACARCLRVDLPLADGYCRGCRWHVANHGPGDISRFGTQLWLGSPVPAPASLGHSGVAPPTPRRPVSEHVRAPGQERLFELRRDWRPVVELARHDLPTLTDSAERLLYDLDSVMKQEMWSTVPTTKTRNTLTVLVSWLGADAPLLESDIRALVDNRSLKFSGQRVTQFLETRGLLVPDAEFRRDAHQKRLEAELAALPATIAQELSVWIKAVRGEGKWEHTGRTYRSIARYWHVLDPILKGWIADGIESLREITQDDIKRAIATRKGTPARSIHIVLRNVFRALRQESVIFRDPTRGLVFAGINNTPPSVPSDRLGGILSHARNDFQRLVMVLVCVHALSGTDMRHLLLTDLDLSRERLIVRRPGKRHIIYLDELTHRCASAWLRARHRRWPVTTNPHLLINRWTAVDTNHSPIGTTFTAIFRPTGLTMPTLRQDRIRDEAFEVNDPLHLMRLFGISWQTSMRYITAAHPERTAKLAR
ncbi:hypothetical protein [Streptomyces sp. AK02-01A]|uniref:hypothetical protein n=1 Tax=Streptomyces sp. AK02-01A TaxID=3028648 RepID=UPI0029BCCAFC|nr:hypothetical protein [Streptomyces sp. AK02-01A]MDX3855614.1 hypothetical protein [Streptomyces sp. AK02-01A]